MPNNRNRRNVPDQKCWSKKAILLGLMLFLLGLLMFLGFSWSMALMIVGVLVILKGLIMKMKK